VHGIQGKAQGTVPAEDMEKWPIFPLVSNCFVLLVSEQTATFVHRGLIKVHILAENDNIFTTGHSLHPPVPEWSKYCNENNVGTGTNVMRVSHIR